MITSRKRGYFGIVCLHLTFELGKVHSKSIRQQVVDMFVNVDKTLATTLAKLIDVNPPKGDHVNVNASSPALSQSNTIKSPQTLKVGILIGNGFDGTGLENILNNFTRHGIQYVVVSQKLGTVESAQGQQLKVSETFLTTYPVLFDSLFVVGGTATDQAKFNSDMKNYIREAFQHYKPILVATTGEPFMEAANAPEAPGVIYEKDNPNFAQESVRAIAEQRFWDRDINI